jgi:hypothetical protein
VNAVPPPSSDSRTGRETSLPLESRADVRTVGLLGLNVWAVALAIPALGAAQAASVGLLLALFGPLVALGLALAALRVGHPAAPPATLAGFPAALALGIGARPELQHGEAHTPFTLAIAVLSFVAWSAAAARALGRPPLGRPATSQPLGPHGEPSPARRRRARARRALLAVTSLGALTLVAIAPALRDRGELERAWGDAAPEGALLTTVAAGALATIVLGAFVGPALRAERAAVASRPSWLRVGFAILAFATGIAAWAVYARAR